MQRKMHRSAGARITESIGAIALAANDDGWTPLQAAARWNAPAMVATLIEAGADVGAERPNGWNALHYAARYGARPEAVDLMLEAGADPNAATGSESAAPHRRMPEAAGLRPRRRGARPPPAPFIEEAGK